MGRVKKESIAAIQTTEGIFCAGCATDEDWNGLKGSDIITLDDIENEDDLYFCDRCSARIGV